MNKEVSVNKLGIFIWLLASIFYLYEFFLRTFIGSVANDIMSDLTLSAEKFAWVTSAYYITYGIMQIPVGILVDKFGVKKILIFGAIICVISTFTLAHSTHFLTAFVSRLLMGFGSSFGFICLLVITSTWFPRAHFAFLIGVSVFLGTMGPLLASGPALKILSSFELNWRNLLDYVGIFGIVLTFAMLVFVKNKNREGTNSTVYLRREESLLYHLKLLVKNSQVWYIAIYSSIAYMTISLIGAVWGLPYLLASGFSKNEAGSVISFCWLGYAVGCIIFGAISDRIQRRRPILIFSALITIMLMLLMIFKTNSSLSFYLVTFSLLGFISAGKTIGFAAITEHVDFATKATAIGFNNCSITIFSGILPVVTGYLIKYSHVGTSPTLAPSDFTSSFLIIPCLSVVSFLVACFCIKETFCKMQKEPIYLEIPRNEAEVSNA